MTVFGYVRRNYPEETANQLKSLMTFECQDIVMEQTSLCFDMELKSLLNNLNKDDKIIVPSLVSFGKTVGELQKIVNTIIQKGARLICIKEKIDTEKVYSFKYIITILDITNKEVTSVKVKQRLVELQASGKQIGRPTIDEKTIEIINDLRHNKKLSLREISRECGVSLGTVHKYLRLPIV